MLKSIFDVVYLCEEVSDFLSREVHPEEAVGECEQPVSGVTFMTRRVSNEQISEEEQLLLILAYFTRLDASVAIVVLYLLTE